MRLTPVGVILYVSSTKGWWFWKWGCLAFLEGWCYNKFMGIFNGLFRRFKKPRQGRVGMVVSERVQIISPSKKQNVKRILEQLTDDTH